MSQTHAITDNETWIIRTILSGHYPEHIELQFGDAVSTAPLRSGVQRKSGYSHGASKQNDT